MNGALTMLLAQLTLAREEAGLTQTALGERIGVGLDAVKSWETGRCKPFAGSIIAYADALGYDLVLVPRDGKAGPVTGRRDLIRRRTGKPKAA